MTSIEIAREYLGQSDVGFTKPGECVAFWNLVNRRFLGTDYPIRNAMGAVDILGVPALYSNAQKNSGQIVANVRPDLVTQVIGLGTKPSIGDWIIWNKIWGGGLGHISCIESFTPDGFIGIEQNFVYHKVTRQKHDWTNVVGYIHYKQGTNMETWKDTNDVRVNGYGCYGIAVAGNDPVLVSWVGKSKLEFFQGLGATVINNTNAANTEIKRLQKEISEGTNCSKVERAFLDSMYQVVTKKV